MKSLFSGLFTKKQKLNVELCQNNLDRFLTDETYPLYEKFLAGSHIQMKEYTCLSECKTCRKSPYAKVNGEVITAESPKELVAKLEELGQ